MSIDRVFQEFPELQTARLVLRQITASDAPALYAILSDEQVTQYYDDDPFTDISQAEEQISAWENGYNRKWMLRWGIAFKPGGDLIGTCGFYGFHRLHLRAAIGYELMKSHWRQGIMSEALDAILAFGFDQVGLNRIQAVVMPDNLASIRLLEKLGFRNEGLLSKYEYWGNKGFLDLCMFGLTRPGYSAL
jgi:ribosomal-protein-alanine N-acetyltransferase